LAEEYDLPVFIHMGPSFPGGAYPDTPAAVPSPHYRASLSDPIHLEEALLRHPGVRVAVVHAGWPMADQMVTMLHHHPQVYAEIGLLQTTSLFPRAEYHAFLKRLVTAGFADRILFGSDASLPRGIDAIMEAEFLTDQQKKDILCGNAARFLRLDEAMCAP
jgi:predicted TIM-barrel fold metal-dependent hydrolase